MGEPVRIADLAGTMIKLSGLVPERDIKIEFTGPRPGEKLNEELKQNDERICATGYDKISVCLPSAIEEDFDVRLAALVQAITDSGKTNYRAAILELVKEYNF
jgi:FlaA1/EpsC-like NDP-sugar epimerase